MTTSIGRVDYLQLMLNADKLLKKIKNGEVTKEELIDNREKEIIRLKIIGLTENNIKRIDYIDSEIAMLIALCKREGV